MCHSLCSVDLYAVKLCASVLIDVVEIITFGRHIRLKEIEGFDLFLSRKKFIHQVTSKSNLMNKFSSYI